MSNVDPDFVIVGAGSAGCVLAERLSESGQHRVLVLEAGERNHWNPWIRMPLGFGKTFGDPAVNWCLATEEDPGLGGRRGYWPRGKTWGGSSAINGLVWIRGFPEDYERWQAKGLAGWGWDQMQPWFKWLECWNGQPSEHRGTSGAIPVQDNHDNVAPSAQLFLDAAEQLQVPYVPDIDSRFAGDGRAQPCVSLCHTNTHNGQRVAGREAFLARAVKRPNVEVRSAVEVERLEGRTVVLGDGTRLTANREVILSAGAIHSPAILLRSGLGEQLPHLGQNLSDHLGINYNFKSRVRTTNSALNNPIGQAFAGLDYLLRRKGPLAQGINPATGFVRTDPSQPLPNIQLYFQALTTVDRFQKSNGERPILEPDSFDAFALGLSNCRPKSRGHIALKPDGSPAIYPNSFSEPQDLDEMLAGVKILRALAASEPLKSAIVEELRPGPSVASDEDLAEDIRNRSGTVYHPTCTCRMGQTAADSVVDVAARVHGLEGVRVIDASIFPDLISANTNATTMAMAAKLSEDILSAHKNSK